MSAAHSNDDADSPSEDEAWVVDPEVAAAAVGASETRPYGRPGRPLDRRSPFFIGMMGAAGVAITYGLVQLTVSAHNILVLVGLAFFIAVGLDPGVSWLTRHRFPRWAAVSIISLISLSIIAGFFALAIPPLIDQGQALIHAAPGYLRDLQDKSSTLGKLNAKYHLQQRISTSLNNGSLDNLTGGILGFGQTVLTVTVSVVTVTALSIYFLAGLPQIKKTLYRFFPQSRRPRTVLLTEEIFTKVGGYVMGNLIVSLVSGVGTFIWLIIFGVPYPFLLAIFVAIADLIPIVGSTIGGVVVSLLALTISLPVAIATLGFYIAYRFAEDYLLIPRVMGRTVNVPGVLTLVAVLLGGVLLGITGALVAIPVAAALRLLALEILFPRLDRN